MQFLKTRKSDKPPKAGEEVCTLGGGSQLTLKDGKATRYISKDPSLVDRECTDFVITEDYLEFRDIHLDTPMSKRIPHQWKNKYPELFSQGHNPERIRIYFDMPGQRDAARAFLDGLVAKMHYTEASKQQRKEEERELADLKRFINERIAVTVGSQAALIDLDGEVSCPACSNVLMDPERHLELVRKAIEARGSASVEKEGHVFCKGCNELYSFKLAITEVAS